MTVEVEAGMGGIYGKAARTLLNRVKQGLMRKTRKTVRTDFVRQEGGGEYHPNPLTFTCPSRRAGGYPPNLLVRKCLRISPKTVFVVLMVF